ncbi:MAG: hypothetical protein PHQ93_00045 [Sulfurimonas sp.]|uniref:hypothetical protein n=1 Tax=Sulfurimonas sp. TaxID=2022749 RepID=UPI002639592B|nr:hypothetical protein [Sulfurimonas sp.]MDD5399565.1 hypothetical protein [Sulfurimonas sp.]
MDEQYLKDEATALKVQKHQINSSTYKLTEIDQSLRDIKQEQEINNETLDEMFNNMHTLLQGGDIQLSNEKKHTLSTCKVVDELDKIEAHNNMTWKEYSDLVKDYGFRNNLDLKDDPFKDLMTESEKIEFQNRIEDEFTFKNAQCDKYDYMIAGTCGVIAGLIDILFVYVDAETVPKLDDKGNLKYYENGKKKGEIKTKKVHKQGKLNDKVDEFAFKIVEKFATFVCEKNKDISTRQKVIQCLENKFKVNYDQTHTNKKGKAGTNGKINNLYPSNHHLKNLGHATDIIGLIVSILNQFTNTSTFVSDGKVITFETHESEINLQGHNFIAKIFCGFANWFGHIMSDLSGSNSSIKLGNRGKGVPIPFFELFLLLDFGEFGKDKQKFAKIATQVFEEGYEARHGVAMAIPVLINELLIRFMYTMKGKFYHQKKWEDCIPKENIPEVRRMLLVGHGTLCIMDGADAAIRSGGDMVKFLLRTNLIAWVRFGHLSLKEVYAWYNSGQIDDEAMDEYLTNDLKRMLKAEIKKGK